MSSYPITFDQQLYQTQRSGRKLESLGSKRSFKTELFGADGASLADGDTELLFLGLNLIAFKVSHFPL